jgi:ATP-dependent Zn protease
VQIKVAPGDRVAEEIAYGAVSTGAESDIAYLTQIARQMVGRWGMSDKLGPVAVLASDGDGPVLPGTSQTSPKHGGSLTRRSNVSLVRRMLRSPSCSRIGGASSNA